MHIQRKSHNEQTINVHKQQPLANRLQIGDIPYGWHPSKIFSIRSSHLIAWVNDQYARCKWNGNELRMITKSI